MLALRLARGARPVAQLRRLVLATAAAGAAFLLLSALAYAAGHPDRPGRALLWLLWCALPLAATVQLAVAVARADPVTRPRSALDAAGLCPRVQRTSVAVSTAIAALLGSSVALLVFLHLRGDLSGLPLDGRAAGLLSGGRPLPGAGAFTLLALVPLTAAGAGALALRPWPGARRGAVGDVPAGPQDGADGGGRAAGPGAADRGGPGGDWRAAYRLRPQPDRTALPGALSWGAVLTGSGIALSAYAAHAAARPADAAAGLPGTLGEVSAGVLAGWALSALGLVLAGPGLIMAMGRALAAGRPGALRLLAGRALEQQAPRLGYQLGTVCAAVAVTLAALRLDGPYLFGPFGALGAAVVLLAVTSAAVTAAGTARTERAPERELVRRLGGADRLLRRTALLRALVLLAVLAPLSGLTAELLVLPLR